MAVQISGNDITVPRDGSFTRNVTIGGTLTYEDVTNIDSVGLVTARTGIEIGARPGVAASISADGNMIVSGISTLGNDVSIAGNLAVDSGSSGMIDFGDITTAYGRLYADNSNGVLIGSKSNHNLVLRTNNTERARIDTSGRLLLNTTTEGNAGADDFTIGQITGSTGITIRSGTTNNGNLYFSDGTSGDDEYRGSIQYQHANNSLHIATNAVERVVIDSSGRVLIGSATADDAAQMLKVARTSGTARLAIQAANDGSSQLDFADVADADIGRIQYDHNSNYMALFTNNSEKFRITSSGEVNIGGNLSQTDSRAHIQDVTRPIQEGTLTLSYANTTNGSADNGATLRFYGHSGTEERYQASIRGAKENGTSGNYAAYLAFSTRPNGSGMVERMRITSYGSLQVSNTGSYAATTPTYHDFSSNASNDLILRLRNTTSTNPYGLRILFDNAAPNDTTRYFIQCNDSSNTRFEVKSNGGIANFSGNDSNLCDEREKKNIVSLDTKWDKVKSWELKKFHYNEDADTDDLRYGVIAQQVEEHCPEVLTPWIKQRAEDAVLDENGNVVKEAVAEIERKGVKEQQMMWMAIKTLQEAQARIETLEAEVAALKSS